MNTEYWLEKLKNATTIQARLDLANDPECPLYVLEVMINYDVELSIIQACVNNLNITDKLKTIGLNRLEKINSQQLNTTICSIPWTHIAIQQNGQFRICCQAIYSPYGKLTKAGTRANIKNTTIDEARNLDELKELRKDMLMGKKHSSCNLCYDEEAAGMISKRQTMLKIYNVENYVNSTNSDGSIDTRNFPLRYIDIRFGNLCNLKCRYCGPSDSSLWYEDFAIMNKQDEQTAVPMRFYDRVGNYLLRKINNKWEVNSLDFKWYEDNVFWEQIDEMLPSIDRYYFTGGEPTINKAHFQLLEILIEKKHSKQISLEYNSNMFAIPDKLYEMWKEFRKVDIGCSIDGIGDMANYLRPPSDWQQLEKNISKLGFNSSSTIHGAISTTVSVYNILHFLDLSQWLFEKNFTRIKRCPSFHILAAPSFMNIQVLPQKIKQTIVDEYEKFFNDVLYKHGKNWEKEIRKNYTGILNYMMAADKSDLLPNLAKHTNKLDKLRGHDLQAMIPWLSRVLRDFI